MFENLGLDTLLDSTLFGIYILDRNGDYIYANASWLKMVGGEKGDLKRLNAFRLIKEGYVTKSAGVMAFEQKRRITLVNKVDNRKGYHYSQLISATPIFDSEGAVEYVVAEMINLQTLEDQMESCRSLERGDRNDWGNDLDLHPTEGGTELIAVSPNMRVLAATAEKVARTDSTVLLSGETGTGKDVMARYIHEHSARQDKPLVVLNCAALPENLLESELFGYEKGAYTGALNTGKEGMIQQANGGTLFLDEVNSMPLSIQGKLLRALEDGRVKRLGALRDEEVDFRLIAATNQPLEECVRNGTFRTDLYYRLSVVPLVIPPLRERKADIIPLAQHFLDRYCQKYTRTKVLGPDLLQELVDYDWPGNVRELKNEMERVVVTSSATAVEIKQLPLGLRNEGDAKLQTVLGVPLEWDQLYRMDPEHFSLKAYLDFCESQVIEDAMRRCGSTRAAAKMLKVDQSTIVRKRQKYKK